MCKTAGHWRFRHLRYEFVMCIGICNEYMNLECVHEFVMCTCMYMNLQCRVIITFAEAKEGGREGGRCLAALCHQVRSLLTHHAHCILCVLMALQVCRTPGLGGREGGRAGNGPQRAADARALVPVAAQCGLGPSSPRLCCASRDKM